MVHIMRLKMQNRKEAVFMNITGSLQKKNGMYHMTVLIPDETGKSIQRTKNTGIRADAKDQLEKRKNRRTVCRTGLLWLDGGTVQNPRIRG